MKQRMNLFVQLSQKHRAIVVHLRPPTPLSLSLSPFCFCILRFIVLISFLELREMPVDCGHPL